MYAFIYFCILHVGYCLFIIFFTYFVVLQVEVVTEKPVTFDEYVK